CSWHVQAYNHVHGEENLLGFVHPAWIAGRFPPAILVGLFRHNPHPLRLLVDCVPQRLVLALPATRRPLEASTVLAEEKTSRVFRHEIGALVGNAIDFSRPESA